MIDIARCESPSQLAYLTPLKVGNRVGKCAPKVGKPLDRHKQCAKCEPARNCRLRITGCGLRFAGCRFAVLAYLLPTADELGRQAQTPVFGGFPACLPTLPTYLLKWMGIPVVGGRGRGVHRGCTRIGSRQGSAGRQGRQPLIFDPRTHRQDYRTRNFLQATERTR